MKTILFIPWLLFGALVGIVISISVTVLKFFLIPIIVNILIDQKVVLKEDSDVYDFWVEIPQSVDFRIYIFNVTNANAIMNGGRPIVQEIGPYIYKQYRKKTILETSEDKTKITYTQEQLFYFDEQGSAPLTEHDSLVVMNMQLNGFLQIAEVLYKFGIDNLFKKINSTVEEVPIVNNINRVIANIDQIAKGVLQATEQESTSQLAVIGAQIAKMFGNEYKSMFMRSTPKEFLFTGIEFCKNMTGLAKVICSLIRAKDVRTFNNLDNGSIRFALFEHKNATNDGIYQVHTGVNNISLLAKVLKWQNHKYLNHWTKFNNSKITCNMINGTDGSVYPPHVPSSGSLYIYSTDICRSVQLFYESSSNYKGIKGVRYKPKKYFLNEIGPKYGTECFCAAHSMVRLQREHGCLLKGALDLSHCHGAPVIFTLPHMLYGAPEYQTVKGLAPNATKHEMFVDIEPLTGYPLRGAKRAQFNMFIKKIDQIDMTKNLKTYLLPAIWVEESFELSDEMIDFFNRKLFVLLWIVDMIVWTIIGSSVALSILMFCRYLQVRKRQNSINITVVPRTRSKTKIQNVLPFVISNEDL